MTRCCRRPVLLGFLSMSLLAFASQASARDDAYTYDKAGRLVTATLGDVTVNYEYDAAGNVLKRTLLPEPDADLLGLAALVTLVGLRRRCRRHLTTAIAGLAMLGAQSAEADCVIFKPSPMRTLAVSDGNPETILISCNEDCTVTTSTSGVSSGSFEVTPAMQFIPSGGSQEFTVSASLISDDGDRGRAQLAYSCGGSSDTVELVIDEPSQETIEHKQGGTDSDPVSTRNGELFQIFQPDLDLGGPLPLRFQRYYASNLASDGNSESNLGTNWLHNFSWSLDTSSSNVQLRTNRGRAVRFLESGSDWVLANRRDIPFQLSGGGLPGYTLIDPRDQLIYKFSIGGSLLSVGDANGNLLTITSGFDPSTGLQIDEITDGLGRTLTFTHQSGVMKSVSDGTRTVSFAHTGDDLTSVTDARGHTTTFSYDPGGLMTAMTRPEGNTPFTQTFGAGGEVLTQTDSNTNTTSFSYAAPDTTITDPALDTRTHTHTASGELSASEDRSGLSVQVGVDAEGRRESITDRLGDETTYTWDDASGKPSSVGHADGTSESFTYTDRVVAGLISRRVRQCAKGTGFRHAPALQHRHAPAFPGGVNHGGGHGGTAAHEHAEAGHVETLRVGVQQVSQDRGDCSGDGRSLQRDHALDTVGRQVGGRAG